MSAGRRNNVIKKDYNTPPKYVNAIIDFFKEVDLDPCSNAYSMIKAKNEFILPMDGLSREWNYKKIFVNPPYGRDCDKKTSIRDWISHGVVANEKFGSELLYLIPVATNTYHFKEIIFKKFSCICFLGDTRLKFYSNGKEYSKGAPMSCCFCYLGKRVDDFFCVFEKFGKCFKIN